VRKVLLLAAKPAGAEQGQALPGLTCPESSLRGLVRAPRVRRRTIDAPNCNRRGPAGWMVVAGKSLLERSSAGAGTAVLFKALDGRRNRVRRDLLELRHWPL